MDKTLPDDKAITVPVPPVDLVVEDRLRTFQIASINHVVVQLADKRLDSIMQACAGLAYDFDNPWPFWFFIGKMVSKALFGDEQQLQWLNAVRVRDREFVAFRRIQGEASDPEQLDHGKQSLQVVEVDFSKPVPGERLKAFWKPARGIIRQRVHEWHECSRNKTLASINPTAAV